MGSSKRPRIVQFEVQDTPSSPQNAVSGSQTRGQITVVPANLQNEILSPPEVDVIAVSSSSPAQGTSHIQASSGSRPTTKFRAVDEAQYEAKMMMAAGSSSNPSPAASKVKIIKGISPHSVGRASTSPKNAADSAA